MAMVGPGSPASPGGSLYGMCSNRGASNAQYSETQASVEPSPLRPIQSDDTYHQHTRSGLEGTAALRHPGLMGQHPFPSGPCGSASYPAKAPEIRTLSDAETHQHENTGHDMRVAGRLPQALYGSSHRFYSEKPLLDARIPHSIVTRPSPDPQTFGTFPINAPTQDPSPQHGNSSLMSLNGYWDDPNSPNLLLPSNSADFVSPNQSNHHNDAYADKFTLPPPSTSQSLGAMAFGSPGWSLIANDGLELSPIAGRDSIEGSSDADSAYKSMGLFDSPVRSPGPETVSDSISNNGSDALGWDTASRTSLDHPSDMFAYARSDAGSTNIGEPERTGDKPSNYLSVPSTNPRRNSDPSPEGDGRRAFRQALPRSMSVRNRRHRHERQLDQQTFIAQASSRAELSPNAISPLTSPVVDIPVSRRGRRSKPMTPEEKKNMREARKSKHVCIRCKASKTTCKFIEEGRCTACAKATPNTHHVKACVRADVQGFISEGPLNLIAHYAVNHVGTDMAQRRRLSLPANLNFSQIMPDIQTVSRRYDIRVHQGTDHVYDLDLGHCYDMLSALSNSLPTTYPYFELIERNLFKKDDWENCVKNTKLIGSPTETLASLIVWGNSPSRFTFSLVHKPTGDARVLNADEPEDQRIIIAAAQVSRMIGRKLEFFGYKELQNFIHPVPAVDTEFLRLLGELVLGLRWRVSWWKVFGIGQLSAEQAQALQVIDRRRILIERVSSVCLTLYMYFCVLSRQRIHPRADIPILKGRAVKYPGTEQQIYETFPADESHEGFGRWMKQGEHKLRESGAVRMLEREGLM